MANKPILDRSIFVPSAGTTADFTVSAAVAGYMTPSSAGAIDGTTYNYAAQLASATGAISDWEVGTGVFSTASSVLARTTVLYSSNSNSKVNFAAPPNVMIAALTYDLVSLSAGNQTISGGANVTSFSLATAATGSTVTINCGNCPLQYVTNATAFSIAPPSSDGTTMLFITNASGCGTVTFTSGFTVGSLTGDSLTTTTGNKFTVSIWRINGVSGYRIAAHQ